MSVLQLLVVGLVWPVFSLFSDNERTVIDRIVAGEFNKEASIVAITGAGLNCRIHDSTNSTQSRPVPREPIQSLFHGGRSRYYSIDTS